ncbi:ATP-dependent DNA helicase [Trichonephila clavipes]|uniref:ATP-dependent DNA helicase n=1 Tax=Trichonephila clavipes TaxID=2585209 RepID=A0A8X6VT67_TRICX|nr:ATP-dependent DNA helicase [Trichonephila clavipes]
MIEYWVTNIETLGSAAINAKRNHFPVVSACAITIQKSKGASFNEVVYKYEKTHSQQLVYVALSRATSLEGLYIVTESSDPKFFHSINNEENIDVPNFHCIAKFQRHNHRGGGVAMHKSKGDTTTYAASEMDVATNTTESFGINESCIGEMCVVKCKAENEPIILMAIIYMSPNQSSKKIIEFIHKNLVAYTVCEAGQLF